jgi:hypothetical protein
VNIVTAGLLTRLPFFARMTCLMFASFTVAFARQVQQAPSPATSAVTPAPAPAPATPQPEKTDPYFYNPAGRRDPFVSLVSRGTDLIATNKRPEGLAGLRIGEIAVRGIVRTQGTYVAMVQGPDKKTHLVHPNDRVLDGVVKSITADAVVFLQDVNDPLTLVKQREVRRSMRAMEDTK